MRPLAHVALRAAALVLSAVPAAARAQDRSAVSLGALVAGLGTTARVLVVGAHPDDEDTPLIAYLSRGRHVRTAYLSVTRGEAGTNLTGGEFGTALGVVRTAETLAAREIDGAEQFFTRAYDFGASKSAAESAQRWAGIEGADAVLGDVVTIIRVFRPQVVVSVHASDGADPNGQHRAVARLVVDAFTAADDTTRFSVSRHGYRWAPTKLYRIVRTDEPGADSAATVRVNVGEYSPLLGRTWVELAAESRSRQRSQGVTVPVTRGRSWDLLRLFASRTDTTGRATDRSLFDGVDTTFARLRRPDQSAALGIAIDSLLPALGRVRAAYRIDDPSVAVTPLAQLTAIAARAAALGGVTTRGVAYDPDVARSLEALWRRSRDALVLASGVVVEAVASREVVARATDADASDTLRVDVTVYNRGPTPIRVESASMSGGPNVYLAPRVDIPPDSAWHGTLAGTPRFITAPWWSAGGRLGDLFASIVDGRTEREWQQTNEAGALVASVRLRIAGGEATATAPVTYRAAEPSRVAERPVAVVPGITVRLDQANEYARAGVPLARPVRVTLQSAYTTPREVRVTLQPGKWLATDSATRTVTLPAGATGVLTYDVRGTPVEGLTGYLAKARVGADEFAEGGVAIGPEHVTPQRLYFPAGTLTNAVRVSIPPGTNVGYVGDPTDRVPLMLAQLGVPMTRLDPAAMAVSGASLSRYTAIVLGPRAYETNPVLLAATGRLFEYARTGGTVVVQQGQYLMEQPGVLPYPITLGRPAQMVTREDAAVRVLAPEAPVLTAPNRIRAEDFDDWVQDRAQFVPATFDARWQPAIEIADPDDPPNRGALLVAPVGRGTYVYTSLSLHKQLVATNPGAARLFVNLLSARPTQRRASSAERRDDLH